MEAPEQKGDTPSPDLAPDAATEVATERSDAVALVGYLGDGSSDQYRRLYESVALDSWIEIRAEDIVDRVAGPGGDYPTDMSTIWVRRDAELAMCESVRASNFEGPGDQDKKWPRP
jgi:hypothetical protein